MSEKTKKEAGDIKRYFKEVSEEAGFFQKSFPDKQLSEKLKKVQEGASEVVKHIEEKTKQG
jgi:hypothetical protein